MEKIGRLQGGRIEIDRLQGGRIEIDRQTTRRPYRDRQKDCREAIQRWIEKLQGSHIEIDRLIDRQMDRQTAWRPYESASHLAALIGFYFQTLPPPSSASQTVATGTQDSSEGCSFFSPVSKGGKHKAPGANHGGGSVNYGCMETPSVPQHR